jgi:hypothetical protein
LLGEKKPVASANARSEASQRNESSPPAPEYRERETENLRRWRASGQARAWVAAHQGQWNHDDWLGLLEELQRSPFWPMHPDAVGQVLEETKRESPP